MYAKESASGFASSCGAWEAEVASPAKLKCDEKDGGDEKVKSRTDVLV
jgi:hypothetical protein